MRYECDGEIISVVQRAEPLWQHNSLRYSLKCLLFVVLHATGRVQGQRCRWRPRKWWIESAATSARRMVWIFYRYKERQKIGHEDHTETVGTYTSVIMTSTEKGTKSLVLKLFLVSLPKQHVERLRTKMIIRTDRQFQTPSDSTLYQFCSQLLSKCLWYDLTFRTCMFRTCACI